MNFRGQRFTFSIHVGLMMVAVAILFYRLLLGEVIFWGTPSLQFYPWQSFAFSQIKQGQLPLWNPFVGNGAPLLANYQTAVFYPPNWLHLIIPSEYAMGIIGAAHIVWAGLGMGAYLRRIDVGPFGQGLGMLSFALSGYVISRFGFLSITTTVAWLPWLMWAADGLIRARSSPAFYRSVAIVAAICAMQLLAGHAQTSLYSIVMAAAYALICSLRNQNTTRRQRISMVLLFAFSVVLGAGLAAIQLLPTAELALSSQRFAGVDPGSGLTYSFWPWRLLTLAAPNLFGSPALGNFDGYGLYWEDAIYVGLLPLVLAGHGVVRWVVERKGGEISEPTRVVPFYVVIIPLVFILALGRSSPVFMWLFDHHMPGIVTFQAPTRWLLLAEFGLCTLAAIGADAWHSSARGLYWTRLITAGGLAVFVGSFLAVDVSGTQVRSTFVTAMLWLGAVTTTTGGLGLLLPLIEAHPRWRRAWETSVLIVVSADLVVAHWGLTPTVPASFYHQPSPLAAVVRTIAPDTRTFYLPAEEQVAKFGEDKPGRMGFLSSHDLQGGDRAHWDEMRASLLPNLGMLTGTPSASNFDPLLVEHYDQLMRQFEPGLTDSNIAAMQHMNVGVMLTPEDCGNLENVGHFGRISACRVPAPWPRALVADCYMQPDESLDCTPGSGTASLTASTSSSLLINVSSPHTATLLVLDTYYPGWVAAVNGRQTVIRRANVAFRAVEVPAGESTVDFDYRPQSLTQGTALTLLSLGVLGTLVVLGRLAKTPSESNGHSP